MAENLTVLDGSTFFVSDLSGDVEPADAPAEAVVGFCQQTLLTVELCFGADFADLYEVKRGRDKRGRTWAEVNGQEVTLWYEHGGYRRGTRIAVEQPASLGDNAIRWQVSLGPREEWQTCIDVCVVIDGRVVSLRAGHGGIGHLQPNMPLSLAEWMADAPTLETDFDTLKHTYRETLVNLAALRFRAGSARAMGSRGACRLRVCRGSWHCSAGTA